MPLINTSVPNLIQGVSQQPDATRFAGQCEEQVNALSSVAEGLKKRPNTRHIAKLLDTAIEDDSLVQFVNRSETERYVVIHTGTKMYAYNIISGAAAGIWYNAVEYTSGWTIPTDHYLYTTASPEKTINALSVGDSTFFVNKNVTVEESTEKTEALVEEAIVTVIQGDYEKRYQVALGDGSEQGAVFLVNTVPINFKGASTQQDFYVITTGDSYSLTVGGPSALRISSVDVSQAGSGYTPNLTNNSNYLSLRFVRWSDVLYIPLTVSTNAAGEITAVSVDGTQERFIDTQGSSLIYGGTSSNSVSTLTVTSGPADGNKGGQNASTERIAQGFAGSTGGTNNGISGTFPTAFDRSRRGSVIKFKRDDGASFTISTSDGLADEGLSLAYTEVASITDLPTRNFNNFQIKIIGDTELAQDDYYVKFETADGSDFGTGSYNEVAGFDISSGIDKSTFPHRLINDEPNSFVVKEAPLGSRQAGDDKANPMPSFVGQKINRLFVHRNRLGILSGDAIIFSEAGELFNFFRTTVSTLLDSAPIDVRVSSKNVVNISSAVGFQENLILFSEAGQFALKSGDLLTSKTVSINPVTNFEMLDGFEPIALGSYIYFPYGKGSFTGIREYTVNATTDTFDSSDIAEHVPAYIPSNVKKMVGSSSENLIALVSGDEPSSLYIYNYFWNNQQKVLSAWSKFTIAGEIRGMEFIDSDLFLVVASEGKTQLLNMPLNSVQASADAFVSESSVDFGKLNVLLDERIEVRRLANTDTLQVKKADGAWSSSAADFPYSTSDATKYKFVTAAGETHVVGYNTNGFFLNDAGITPFYQINIYGYLGRPYDMEYKFSTQLFKASSGKGASPSAASAMTIRNGAVFFDETSEFTVKVTPEGRPMASNVFLASSRPDAETYNGVKFSEGFFRFPVYSKAKHANITLQNSSPFDCKFSSAEFESFVHPRSNRYG